MPLELEFKGATYKFIALVENCAGHFRTIILWTFDSMMSGTGVIEKGVYMCDPLKDPMAFRIRRGHLPMEREDPKGWCCLLHGSCRMVDCGA